MAALTLPAVLSQMNVVLLMAGQTGRIELDLVGGLLVTPRAGELFVGAVEGKSRFLAMVEVPLAPAVGRVALVTALAQGALVDVHLLMTRKAVLMRILISPGRMALAAGDDDVLPEEGELRQVVIEMDVVAPSLRRVTLSAVRAELSEMNITDAMTIGALLAHLLTRQRRSVTGGASYLGMQAGQCPVSIAIVVERGRFPRRIAMALATILTEARGMCILTCMATNAVLGNLLLQIAAAMAVLTVHMSVCALQGKTSFPGVVKLLRLPAGS